MSNRASQSLLVPFVIFFVSWSGAEAGAYRWVDEHGVTVYSQTPRSSGESVQVKEPPGPSAEATEEARERLRQQIEQSFDAREAAKQRASEEAKQAEALAHRTANCTAARRNLETLENLGPRMLRMPDGEYVRLSEEEVETQKKQARKQIEAFCD